MSDVIDGWLDAELSGPVLHVKSSASDVRHLLSLRAPVITVEAPSGSFTEALAGFRGYVETLIDRFTRLEDLVISDELQHLLDQGLYNPQLADLFEDLWTARFEFREGRDFGPILQQLLTDTFDVGSVSSRCDALLFWFAIMGQNYTVEPGKVNLIVQGSPDGDLALLFSLSEVWQSYGSPLRILVLS